MSKCLHAVGKGRDALAFLDEAIEIIWPHFKKLPNGHVDTAAQSLRRRMKYPGPHSPQLHERERIVNEFMRSGTLLPEVLFDAPATEDLRPTPPEVTQAEPSQDATTPVWVIALFILVVMAALLLPKLLSS